MSTTPRKLAADDLSYSSDGESIVREIDIAVATGETLAILGPSGAGKSTILRLLCRLAERGVVERDTIGASLAWSVADGLPDDQANTATEEPEQ